MTRAEAREQGMDITFHATREDAEPWAASFTEVTGRTAVSFEEEFVCGSQSYTMFMVATGRRPRPVVTVVT